MKNKEDHPMILMEYPRKCLVLDVPFNFDVVLPYGTEIVNIQFTEKQNYDNRDKPIVINRIKQVIVTVKEVERIIGQLVPQGKPDNQ